MASIHPDLTRAGTMEVTAKEGQQYLESNLTEWKKPMLMDQFEKPAPSAPTLTPEPAMPTVCVPPPAPTVCEPPPAPTVYVPPPAPTVCPPAPKPVAPPAPTVCPPAPKPVSPPAPKISKCTTMVGTAKEAESILAAVGKPDDDAHTRGQQKKIVDIQAEEPPAKKPKMARDSTMAVTAKEGTSLLGDEKLADTRAETKAKQSRPKASPRRSTTIDKATEEAKLIYGDIDLSGGRSLRKRAAPPPPPPKPKRAGTMQKTAKEGKAYLKRGRKPKKAVEEEDVEEEEEEKKEEEKKDTETTEAAKTESSEEGETKAD